MVAVVGNPNAGKTTIFNSLTGASQKVGNYPGVTVERVSAELRLEQFDIEIVDVPGLYSLDPVSEDERVAVDVIKGTGVDRQPDAFICVVSAANLERNLYLYTQLAETGLPIVVAVSMTDVLARKGKTLNVAKLSNLLGAEVIPVIGHKKRGVSELRAAVERALVDRKPAGAELGGDLAVESVLASLAERFARSGVDSSRAELKEFLANAPSDASDKLKELPELLVALDAARARLENSPSTAVVADRYKWAAMVQSAVVQESLPSRRSGSDKIDYILTHRLFGLIVFVAIMYAVFLSIYSFAQPLMGWIESGFAEVGALVSPMLERWPAIQSLVVDGLIGGVGAALVFLPQIVILFFFIAVLEGTGYLARAAFLMDKLLGWAGLNGRAFVPLLSSFACAIPGIMAARVMPDPKSRLATILIAPLMSCSARLPVYILLIGAFVQPLYGSAWAGFALFAMHFLGLFVAIPVVFVLNRGLLKGRRLPFLLELPPYQWPKWRDVWISMFIRAKTFLQTAGTIIVVMSIVIWATLYFPRSQEADLRYAAEYRTDHSIVEDSKLRDYVDGRRMENSILGRFGKAIEPAFVPAGFDWRLSTAILCAFPAREVVVASMGVIFNLGDDENEGSGDLISAIQRAKWPDGRPLMTPWTAAGLMVFFALCCQCMATLATVRRETGTWKWPVFMFVYMTALAYLFAVAINQIGILVSS